MLVVLRGGQIILPGFFSDYYRNFWRWSGHRRAGFFKAEPPKHVLYVLELLRPTAREGISMTRRR